ncbi:MAG TPA: hypothetical protein VFV50_07350 [Bdellovibrionales bacterium]|nr:hypothetical protein [Bdellovibrionales bacterium]
MTRLFIAAALVLCGRTAAAGIRTVSDVVLSSPGPKNCRMETYLDGNFFRYDNKCDGAMSSMIFTLSPDLIHQVDHQRKTYSTMSLKDYEQMIGQMGASMKAMQAQMKASLSKLPPAQREAMMKMMAGQMPAQVKRTVKKTGRAEKVGSFSCLVEEEWQGKTKVGETCVGDWKQFGINIEKYKAIGDRWKRLGDKMKESAGSLGEYVGETDMKRGYLVRHRSYNNGKVDSEMILREIKETSVDPSLGKVPAGYKKEENPMAKIGAKKKGG